MPRPRPLVVALAFLGCFVGAAWAQSAKVSALYEDALKRYQARELDAAAIQLKNALQEDRKFLPAQLLLGKVELENSSPNAAEGAFLQALSLGASRSEVVVPLARALMAQGKQARLLADANLQVAGLAPQTQAQLLLVRGAALSDLGDERAALDAILQARALAPQSADSWVAETPIRIRTNKFPEALAAAERALELDPRNADAHNQRGAALHVLGRLADATQAYSNALAIEPQHLDALLARAGLALDREDLRAAKQDIDRVRAKYPRDPRADYLAALVAERSADRAGSLAAMQRVADLLGPVPLENLRFRPQFLLLGALAHHAIGATAKARPYLEYLIKQQPRSPGTKLLAQLLFDAGEVENGVRLLEQYLQLVPNDLQAMGLLATGHSKAGRQSKAIQLMSRALERGDNTELRSVLGSSLLRAGQFGAAQKELEQAWQRTPRSPSAGVALAMLYLRTQQAAKAAEVARALVALDPSVATYPHLLGMAQAGQGKGKDARASFEKALQLGRHIPEVHMSLARLDAAEGKLSAALSRLNEVHRRNTEAIEPMLELAALHMRHREPDKAQGWLERAAAAAGPRDTRAGVALTNLLLVRLQTAKAVEQAKNVLAKQPENTDLLALLARTLLASGDANGARAPLLNASRRVSSADELAEIGALQLDAGDLPNGYYTLSKATESDPKHFRSQLLLARAEAQRGDLAAASRRAAQLESSNPRDAATHLLAADIATSRQQPAAALKSLRRAHELEPSALTAARLFQHLAVQDAGAAAQQFAESWLKRHPDDLPMLRSLAQHLAARQQLREAKLAYEQLLRRQPTDAPALNNLALVLLRLGERDAALATAERALAQAPREARVIDTVAWLLHLKGEHARALAMLRDARTRAPEHAEIRYHLAAALARAGNTAEARQEIESALAQPNGLVSVKEARELASTLK